MALDSPDFRGHAKAVPFHAFGAHRHHNLAVTLEILPVYDRIGKRMVPAADQFQLHPADRMKAQLRGQILLPPHDAEIRFPIEDQPADVFHHREQQLEFDMRKMHGKLGKQFAQRVLGIEFVYSDHQTLLHMRFKTGRHADQVLTPVEDQPRFRQQAFAGGREGRIAPLPTEQLQSEILLKVRDLRADGRLRLAQCPASGRERAVFGRSNEGLQRRMFGDTNKTFKMRLVHTVLFEIGLLAILLPPIAWYLNMGLFETLQLDLAIVAFYLVYNFVFNLAYDRVFPIPAGRRAEYAT